MVTWSSSYKKKSCTFTVRVAGHICDLNPPSPVDNGWYSNGEHWGRDGFHMISWLQIRIINLNQSCRWIPLPQYYPNNSLFSQWLSKRFGSNVGHPGIPMDQGKMTWWAGRPCWDFCDFWSLAAGVRKKHTKKSMVIVSLLCRDWLRFLELHVLKEFKRYCIYIYILWTYLNWQLFSQDCSIYVKIC